MFGGNKKEPRKEAPQPQAAAVEATLKGKKAAYFTSMRTDAYNNSNPVNDYIEFWVAQCVDVANNKWQVMHYMLQNFKEQNGKFVAETETKEPVSFIDALALISQREHYMDGTKAAYTKVDMVADYPGNKYPEIETHFHEIEHFKAVGNMEGVAFSTTGKVFPAVEGRIVDSGTFVRDEVQNVVEGPEQARSHPQVKTRIEQGILSDIFGTESARKGTLDDVLKVGQILIATDRFAVQAGAFYLTVQCFLGIDDGYSKIGGLSPDESGKIQRQAEGYTGLGRDSYGEKFDELVGRMNETLDQAEAAGLNAKPFRKHVAECALYANLLEAARDLSVLKESFKTPGGADMERINQIRSATESAEKKFIALGGTAEQVDKLKAWIDNDSPDQDRVPAWLPGFLTRYYEARANTMADVQRRKSGATHVRTIGLEVKPPLTDENNPGMTAAQVAAEKRLTRPTGPGGAR